MARPDLEALLDAAAAAFEDGDPDRALRAAGEALAVDRRSGPALHYRAAALSELGRDDEARAAYREALARGGDDVDLLVDAARFLLRSAGDDAPREDAEAALELARRAARLARSAGDERMAGEAWLAEGRALLQIGDAPAALERLEAARSALPDDPDVLLERAVALFELCRFEEAREQYREVLDRAGGEAAAHHGLGLALERLGRAREAGRHLARARALAPDDYPAPVSVPPAEFERLVEEALQGLPAPVRSYLGNVAIAVEDLPAASDLLGSDPPLSPGILGIFRGSPLPQKASMDPWSHFPSSISLYQRNLERFARSREELVEEIRVTLLHEVGHFLGLDEDELYRRGLD